MKQNGTHSPGSLFTEQDKNKTKPKQNYQISIPTIEKIQLCLIHYDIPQ